MLLGNVHAIVLIDAGVGVSDSVRIDGSLISI
jgi:hypothetical protein